MLGKNFSICHFEIVFLYFLENKIWHHANCLLKCQILFSRKNKKKYHINLLSVELAQRGVKV